MSCNPIAKKPLISHPSAVNQITYRFLPTTIFDLSLNHSRSLAYYSLICSSSPLRLSFHRLQFTSLPIRTLLTMFSTKSTLFFAAVAISLRLASAIPPACLLAAVKCVSSNIPLKFLF